MSLSYSACADHRDYFCSTQNIDIHLSGCW